MSHFIGAPQGTRDNAQNLNPGSPVVVGTAVPPQFSSEANPLSVAECFVTVGSLTNDIKQSAPAQGTSPSIQKKATIGVEYFLFADQLYMPPCEQNHALTWELVVVLFPHRSPFFFFTFCFTLLFFFPSLFVLPCAPSLPRFRNCRLLPSAGRSELIPVLITYHHHPG